MQARINTASQCVPPLVKGCDNEKLGLRTTTTLARSVIPG